MTNEGKPPIDIFLPVDVSSSRTSATVKAGPFNAKIQNKNDRYTHKLTYQLNEQHLLSHSIQNVSLILVTSLLDGHLKWSIWTS